MKKFLTIAIIAIFTAILTVGLAGCDSSENGGNVESEREIENYSIVGTWRGDDGILTLVEGGDGIFNGEDVYWRTDGNEPFVLVYGEDEELVSLETTLSGDVLTITIDGVEMVFERE